MTINNVNQLFQEKLTEINSRLPKDTNIKNKFDSILEQAQLRTPNTAEGQSDTTNTSNISEDPTTLLKNMIATQSYLSSTTSLFSSDSANSNNLFPASTLNNSINTLQQNLLLKALENKKE